MSKIVPVPNNRVDNSGPTFNDPQSSCYANDLLIDEYNAHLRKRDESLVPPPSCLVDISNPWRIRWNSLIILLALYSCLSIPYMLAFTLSENDSILVIGSDLAIDCLFISDVILVLRTSYINLLTGEHVNDWKGIAKEYLRTGKFFIDFIANFPSGFVTSLAGVYSPYIRLLKLFRLPKVSEIAKFITLTQVRDNVKLLLRISKLVLYMYIYLHFIACAWYVVVIEKGVWIPVTDVLSETSPFYSESPGYQYAYCFYIAVCALVGIESYPQTTAERGFIVGTTIMGAMFSSYILGEITDAVGSLGVKENLFKNYMRSAADIMKHFTVKKATREQVKEYLRYTYPYIVKEEEWDSFIKNLHPKYIKLVNSHLYASIICRQPLFTRCRKAVEYVINRLKITFIKPENRLMEIGDPSDSLCFVIGGEFDVKVCDFSGKSVYVRSLYQGDICGEIGLIYRTARTATIKAQKYSNAALLSKLDFYTMLDRFPLLWIAFRDKISQYNDPYRQGLKKILQRLPYLKKLGRFTIDKILFSLTPYSFHKHETVINEKSVINNTFLVIEGEIGLFVEVYDKSLSMCRTNTMESTAERNVYVKKNSTQRSGMPLNLYRTYIPVCSLGPGSLISGTLSLFRSTSPFVCRANSFSTLLYLNGGLLEEFAQSDTVLRGNIRSLKNQYIHSNSLLNTKILISPVLDYVKYFPNNECSGKLSHRTLQKAKNVIFMSILRRRSRIQGSSNSFKSVSSKLSAIAKAEQKNMKEIARKIETDELSPQIVGVAKYLKGNEVHDPVLVQFAGTAKLTKTHLRALEAKHNDLLEQLALLSMSRARIRTTVQKVMKLLN